MIDLYFFKIDVFPFMLIVAGIVSLAVQLLFCFKVKCVWIRLVPVFLSTLAIIFLIALAFVVKGWDAVACVVFALVCAFSLAVCGFCWGIWGIVCLIRRGKRKS